VFEFSSTLLLISELAITRDILWNGASCSGVLLPIDSCWQMALEIVVKKMISNTNFFMILF
jgi:hypothetical protein